MVRALLGILVPAPVLERWRLGGCLHGSIPIVALFLVRHPGVEAQVRIILRWISDRSDEIYSVEVQGELRGLGLVLEHGDRRRAVVAEGIIGPDGLTTIKPEGTQWKPSPPGP